MTEARFPPGWDEERVQRVIDHYEHLSEDEAVAEDLRAVDASLPLHPAQQFAQALDAEDYPAARALFAGDCEYAVRGEVHRGLKLNVTQEKRCNRSHRPPHVRPQHFLSFRPLAGIIESPILRPDGTILNPPGYDAATGFLHEPAGPVPSIPDSPTRADAMAARDVLLDSRMSAWVKQLASQVK